jgi:Cd2+/Zn2+-exporting ATPase/Cu+-exporting ATPase
VNPSHEDGAEAGEEHVDGVAPLELARIAFVAVCAAAVWLRVWEPLPGVSVIGLVGAIVGGWPILAEAAENFRERRMTMELSMTIALVAAMLIGEFFTALVITAFVLAAEVLEGLTVGRGRRALKDLVALLPQSARVRAAGDVRVVPLTSVRVDDLVLVNPGERLPVDGRVVAGHSHVDQSAITGESVPVAKTVGASVYAGTINQSGALEVRAEKLGRDTSFGKIVAAVEQAERSRAPVQKVADRYAGYLVYLAIGCALLTFLLTRNIRSTISVIIVAGACGIAAGTPLAILGAIGRAARAGVIIKGGRYLEALWSVDTVALDKTGTLTTGVLTVLEVLPATGVSAGELLESAALAERRSEHPVAEAIRRHADDLRLAPIEPESFDYTPGRGVTARLGGDEVLAGNRAFMSEHGVPALAGGADAQAYTEVLVARGGRFLGTIRVADAVRPQSAAAVTGLHGLGIRTVLLTGDARAVAAAVSRRVGVSDVRAELLPDEKVAEVRRLSDEGRRVAMVGDGLNDAPALMAATVGVAMDSGTDVARESADVVLIGGDLTRFVAAIATARRARAIIRFNFAGTIAVDAVGVGLAAFGYLNPLVAAFIHVSSELAFILNSARLLPARPSTAGRAAPSSAAAVNVPA